MTQERIKQIMDSIWDDFWERAQSFPGEPEEGVFEEDWFEDEIDFWKSNGTGPIEELFEIFSELNPGQSEDDFEDWLGDLVSENPPPK